MTAPLPGPIAYLAGQFVPADEARLPVSDLGIVGGLAVTEMLRTIGHRPFRQREHLERLTGSLAAIGLRSPVDDGSLPGIIERVVAHNTALIDAGDDLGVIVFVTAGPNPTYVGRAAALAAGPTLCVHTFALQYELFADRYHQGVTLQTVAVPALPTAIVTPMAKVRSRLHWHQAERAARQQDPTASAVLLDEQGHLLETAAANVLAMFGTTLVSPPVGTVLEGISLQAVLEAAVAEGLAIERRPLPLATALQADEIWLTSTPSLVLPVVGLNGQPIGPQAAAIGATVRPPGTTALAPSTAAPSTAVLGRPGPLYRRITERLWQTVGVDLAAQARRWA